MQKDCNGLGFICIKSKNLKMKSINHEGTQRNSWNLHRVNQEKHREPQRNPGYESKLTPL
jgi:hypothetical protein